jgi:hypothetical protein
MPNVRDAPGEVDLIAVEVLQWLFYTWILRQSLFATLQDLEAKDPTRGYSSEQRLYVFLRDGKKCSGIT